MPHGENQEIPSTHIVIPHTYTHTEDLDIIFVADILLHARSPISFFFLAATYSERRYGWYQNAWRQRGNVDNDGSWVLYMWAHEILVAIYACCQAKYYYVQCWNSQRKDASSVTKIRPVHPLYHNNVQKLQRRLFEQYSIMLSWIRNRND